MRKNAPFLFLLIIISIIATSCNKTWYCVCSTAGVQQSSTPITSLGKMGAKNVCDGYQEQNNRNGSREICVIK
ncbi:MAG: hypothetical protein IT271_06440 [Chitinophagales bacterium]|nr:hypothetical protein [Chitinophagales bacterium]